MDIGNRWKMYVVKRSMPNFMYQKKFHKNYYMSLLLIVTTFLYLYVYINSYFHVH